MSMTNESNASPPQAIAGFWRRLGAFFLDCLALGVAGVALGLFLADELASLGAWGRLLGFFVALIYFGILNSTIAGGQTLGKRVLGLRVVAKDGTPLSVAKSALRFLPLGAPWFLNFAQFPESVLSSFWSYVLSVAVFGIGLSIIYMYVFNRRSRQSLHDLLVGSYVVTADTTGPVVVPAGGRAHLAVCALLIVVSGIAPYFAKNLAASEPFASSMSIYRAVNSEPWVLHAGVYRGQTVTTTTNTGTSTTTYLYIVAHCKDPDVANAERAKRLAALALSTDESAASVDVLQVTLRYGYDIGIASSWRSQNHVHTPEEWNAQSAAVQETS